MSSSFNVRLFRPEDLPAILQLWEDHSGWGGITEQQWHEWYMDTPWGESVVLVVEDLENEIVGQSAFTPFPLRLNGQTGTAYRISAPILKESIRAGRVISPDHPTRRMLDVGLTEVGARGAMAAYAMPLISWRGFFRRIPGFHVQEYGCACIDLRNNTAQSEAKLDVEAAETFGIEHSNLWRDAMSLMPIQAALERTEALWNYRLSKQLVLNVRTYSGDLMGYIAIKRESGLVLDMLARNSKDLKLVITAGVQALAKRHAEFINCPSTIKLMVTPQIEPIVKELEIPLDDFRFLFSVIPTQEGVEPESVAPQSWFLTAGD